MGLYRRQGRLGHPPGLRGSNRLQRARHGAGPDRRARRAHRPPGPDSQDAAAGRAQLGLPARTDAGRDRGAAAAAPVQRRHGPRADAAGRRHGAGRADAGPDPRATARLALQRLVGTAERQWPLGRAAGNAALRRGAAARRQRHRRAPRRALAVRGPAGPTAVEATLWRSRRAACAGRMAGQAGTQRSGDTAGRRPPADAQLQAGLCLAGKARRLDGAARRRSDPAGRSRRPAQHPVPAARPRGHPERSRLGLCPDLGRRHRCDDRRGDGRGG